MPSLAQEMREDALAERPILYDRPAGALYEVRCVMVEDGNIEGF
jgi:hypothetical protein